ncbi:MAG TPA: InlB B-repeat-containing protein [Kiritimatiellia bacterium]|nr:InlB B-repeat-containing protein [Kiritimatiellia bacterium]HOM58510.1 InlB B-repeat-containing protein [Kiritimatiellia bacterium]
MKKTGLSNQPPRYTAGQANAARTVRRLAGCLCLAGALSAAGLEVWSLDDLQKVGSGIDGWEPDAVYTLMTNLDASATADWNGGAGFVPIGRDAEWGFTGVFNGNGHRITGLTLNRPGESDVGLFGRIGTGGVVSNLCLTGITVAGLVDVGGVAGYLSEGLIRECSVSGDVVGLETVGGVAGFVDLGGIERSSASGSVVADVGAGGLVGYLYEGGTIGESYAIARVSGTEDTGGLVGSGSGFNSVVSGAYWDTQASGQSSSWGGGTGKTSAEMRQAVTFSGWDFSQVWGIVESVSYPYLRGLAVNGNEFVLTVASRGPGNVFVTPLLSSYTPGTNVTVTAQPVAGVSEFVRWSGGVAQPTNPVTQVTMAGHVSLTAIFRSARGIGSVQELQRIGRDPDYTLNGRYWLTGMLYAGETAGWPDGFGPIGSMTTPFTGSFDGRSNVIARLKVDRPEEDYAGLFGVLGPGAVIRNLGLTYAEVCGNGGLGALVGYNAGGTVERCFAEAQVNGTYNGIGGLIGENREGTVNRAYAVGSVAGQSNVGGLIGLHADGGSVTQTYAACVVTGTSSGVGGLIGWGDGITAGSFWDTEVSGQSGSAGGVPQTTSAMRQAVTYSGWDFIGDWQIVEGEGYPRLRGFARACTVTFDALGGTVEPATAVVDLGGVYGDLPVPERTGYVWEGWRSGPGGAGTPVTEDTVMRTVTNHTVYAHWRADALIVVGGASDAVPIGFTNAVQVSTNHCGDGGTSVCLGGKGIIADGQMAGIEWSVTGPGLLSFCWRTSSEADWDVLRFYEAGTGSIHQISGIMNNWEEMSILVEGGQETPHLFRWEYEKDPQGDYVGQDCGWVDALRWVPFHPLTVIHGSGGGAYSNGTVVAIQADSPPAYHVFDRWTGDTNSVADVLAASTTVTMSGTGMVLTASYQATGYPLTVIHGSGSGVYPYGSQVVIGAEVPEGKQFDCWTGDVATVADRFAPTTTVTTTDSALCVAATYRVPLTVVCGSGSGWYAEGSAVMVAADPAPLYQEFAGWNGDATSALANATAPSTVLTMPSQAVTLIASYRDSVARLLGCYGPAFTCEGVVDGLTGDAMSGAPSGTPAVKLGGPGVVPDNGFTAFELQVWGSGTVSFWWRVSSEPGADFLRFLVDGTPVMEISGTKSPWTAVTNTVSGTGTWHTLRWEYRKNGAEASSSDAGWVDDVIWTGDVPQPWLTPDILLFAVTNDAFCIDFLGERGIPYQVQTNALLRTDGWGGMSVAPVRDGETNGVHRFRAGMAMPGLADTLFFRIRAGGE